MQAVRARNRSIGFICIFYNGTFLLAHITSGAEAPPFRSVYAALKRCSTQKPYSCRSPSASSGQALALVGMTSLSQEPRSSAYLLRFFFAVGGLALVLWGFAAAAAI